MQVAPNRSGNKSGHYCFFDLWFDPVSGVTRRLSFPRESQPKFLLSYYENPSASVSGMDRMVFFIGVDIDAKETRGSHLDAEGRVCHNGLLSFLESTSPDILEHVTAIARSRSGKGLHVIFRVSPFPLVSVSSENSDSKYLGVNQLATSVQKKLVSFFNFFGFGADPCAIGPRLWANWIDGECVYKNDGGVESELRQERRSVLLELAASLNELTPEIRRMRLYNDSRVEAGLARLFMHLLSSAEVSCPWPREEVSALGILNGELETLSRIRMSMDELRGLTGCSAPLLRSILSGESAHGCPWLRGRYDARTRQWEIEFVVSDPVLFVAWKERARTCMHQERASLYSGHGELSPGSLCPPHEVEDGFRNNWIWRFCAIQKLQGFTESETLEQLNQLLPLIPESQTSRSVQGAKSVLRSIFNCQKATIGLWEKQGPELPYWLKELDGYVRQRVCIINEQKKQTIEARRAVGKFYGVVVSSRTAFFPFRLEFADGRSFGLRFQGSSDGLVVGDSVEVYGSIEKAEFETKDGEIVSFSYLHAHEFLRTGFELRIALCGVAGVGERLANVLEESIGSDFLTSLETCSASDFPGVGKKTLFRLRERFLDSGRSLYADRLNSSIQGIQNDSDCFFSRSFPDERVSDH